MTGPKRVERWERWLSETFPASHFARAPDLSSDRDGLVWSVEFQDGKLGRIHLGEDALQMDDHDFRGLTERLRRMDWYAYLDQFVCIRIGTQGPITPVRDFTGAHAATPPVAE